MPTAVVVMMFCASAPLFLMPATIALWVNRPRSVGVVVINLALWVVLYFQVSAGFNDAAILPSHFPFRTGVVGVLIAWLLLLRYALERNARPSENNAPL
jgi:hypothetical protein